MKVPSFAALCFEYGSHVSTNRELINSSTCALCDLVSPASISFSKTARTSIGGFKPSTFARFHRFRRAMPMHGYRTLVSIALIREMLVSR